MITKDDIIYGQNWVEQCRWQRRQMHLVRVNQSLLPAVDLLRYMESQMNLFSATRRQFHRRAYDLESAAVILNIPNTLVE